MIKPTGANQMRCLSRPPSTEDPADRSQHLGTVGLSQPHMMVMWRFGNRPKHDIERVERRRRLSHLQISREEGPP